MYWLDVVSYRSDVPPVAYVSRLSTLPLEQLTCHLIGAVEPAFIVLVTPPPSTGGRKPPIEKPTVTLKLPVLVLPAASVAVQVTVVVPGANVLPEAGVQLGTPGPSTTSLDSAEYVTLAPAAEVAYAKLSAGSCNVGAVVSTTLTVKLPLVWLPRESYAVQCTVVVASGYSAPDAESQLTVTSPSTRSVAVAS